MKKYDNSSKVEETALSRYGKKLIYPPYEKIGVLEVPNFPSLGKITSLRFIEWLQKNPGGVISLPTGKTPEHFIKWTVHYLAKWNESGVKKELKSYGIDASRKPEMKSYRFVQIDEFYPINPNRENSFNHYIRQFYVKGLGLDIQKTLLMDAWTAGAAPGKNLSSVFPDGRVDLSLRYRKPKNETEHIQQEAIYGIDRFAMEYEERIDELGGIGFFLGGIGPDGHIAFNIRGSDHNSTTRVLNINYETAAASASDLGGIEVSRDKAVLTIGLHTIAKNPEVTAVIMAAGESKAAVVRDAVEKGQNILYPATALHKTGGARFYLTAGAACMLTGRKINRLREAGEISASEKEKILVDISHARNKKISHISHDDVWKDAFGRVLLEKEKKLNLTKLAEQIDKNFRQRIYRGRQGIADSVFLHTAPHHDDIMLGYLPYILHLVREPSSSHFFATLTSGFTSITNGYALSMFINLEVCVKEGKLDRLLKEKGYFKPDNIVGRNRDIYRYLDGVAAGRKEIMREAEARRGFRAVSEIAGSQKPSDILKKIASLKREILNSYPGKKDIPEMQRIKGTIREWEEELLWAHLGFSCENIFHLRLGFYTGDIFTPQPEWERDVKPFLSVLKKVNPDILTVAFDPEGTGPDTHYKVLQVIAEGLKKYVSETGKTPKVWGYRNIWYRFHPSDANIYVPVSMNSLAILKSAFDICFASQKSASFPSHEYDGPFSELAQKILVEQGAFIKRILGRDFFGGSQFARIRASRGVNFIKEMDIEEFFAEARSLRRLME
ncbi:MAG: 6-phosphogluconolactonase [Candidatus Omnitrophica bacterium]|nr:6-phosphogluconolactonase [Candidatus Omnitrophota bacterium]